MAFVAAFTAVSVAAGRYSVPNMNGAYFVSKTPGAPADKSFPTNFMDYPGGVESFDAYHGPIKSVYSEVWWTTAKDNLPAEVVRRFDGKVMAIVGIEMDQVRRTPDGDVPVPITHTYNHHHNTMVVGKGARMEEVPVDDPRVAAAGRKQMAMSGGRSVWLPVEHARSPHGVPTSAMFDDANGGEYRKSFHAYAPPFAQLVDSPTEISGIAMQIDTWNREKMNITGGAFVPGPVPRRNLAPTSGPDAIYSGLLECPLTTRIQKIYSGGGSGFDDIQQAEIFACSKPQKCAHAASTAAGCFANVQQLPGLGNATVANHTVADGAVPPGCTVSVAGDGTAKAVFNTNASSAACCGIGPAGETVGTARALATLRLRVSAAESAVTLTLTGPAARWFGVGFGAALMRDAPYTIVVDGGGGVSERKLGDHAAGAELAASVRVVSNTVTGGERTVVLTRPLQGATHDHYSFTDRVLAIPLITAVGSGPELAYHKAARAAGVQLWPGGGAPACVCTDPALPFGQGHGQVKYLPTGQTVGFSAGRCPAQPRGDLLAQRNPTCDLRAYAGGLVTCHHGWRLLDADQEVPWQDEPLEYYKKFRVYFQEYNASHHVQIARRDWGIGAGGNHDEYDVPRCAPGTPTAQCTHTITGTWQPVGAGGQDVHLAALHHHCHAPTCLRIDTYNNDTGELLCRVEPVYGGGQMGRTASRIDRPEYDEPGYIATQACMWGKPEHGLAPPPRMNGMTIRVVSTTNNTYGHHGEMALPQAMIAVGPLGPPAPTPPPAPRSCPGATADADMSVIFGHVSSPGASAADPPIRFLGDFGSLAPCQAAFRAAAGAYSYAYVTPGYSQPAWRKGCYALLVQAYRPHKDVGVISGQCAPA